MLNRSPEDPYYLSHTPSTQPSTETLPSATTSEGSIQGTSSGISAGDNDVRAKEELSSSSEEEEDEEDTEEEKAPFELIGEVRSFNMVSNLVYNTLPMLLSESTQKEMSFTYLLNCHFILHSLNQIYFHGNSITGAQLSDVGICL